MITSRSELIAAIVIAIAAPLTTASAQRDSDRTDGAEDRGALDRVDDRRADGAEDRGALNRADDRRAERVNDRRELDGDDEFEIGFGIRDTDAVGVVGLEGARLDVESELGYSFWGGHNFGARWSVLGELTVSTPDYVATLVGENGTARTVSAALDMTTLHVKGAYRFMDGPITPFVELGAGWTNLDSNLIRPPAFIECFFDPFFGFVCSRFYNTYQETRTSYGGSVGVRWEVGDYVVLRASVGQLRIDADAASDNIELDTAQLAAAWKFGA